MSEHGISMESVSPPPGTSDVDVVSHYYDEKQRIGVELDVSASESISKHTLQMCFLYVCSLSIYYSLLYFMFASESLEESPLGRTSPIYFFSLM